MKLGGLPAHQWPGSSRTYLLAPPWSPSLAPPKDFCQALSGVRSHPAGPNNSFKPNTNRYAISVGLTKALAHPMNAAITYALLLLLGALATLLIAYGALLLALGHWSRRWPAVPGTIESSALVTGRNGDGIKAYWVKAKYTYHWGRPRNGSWIGFAHPGTASNSKFTKSKAEALHKALVPCTSVSVYVCPQFPSIAVLLPGHNMAALGYIALSPIFAFLPLWFGWSIWQG